jgi:hypothetical protein
VKKTRKFGMGGGMPTPMAKPMEPMMGPKPQVMGGSSDKMGPGSVRTGTPSSAPTPPTPRPPTPVEPISRPVVERRPPVDPNKVTLPAPPGSGSKPTVTAPVSTASTKNAMKERLTGSLFPVFANPKNQQPTNKITPRVTEPAPTARPTPTPRRTTPVPPRPPTPTPRPMPTPTPVPPRPPTPPPEPQPKQDVGIGKFMQDQINKPPAMMKKGGAVKASKRADGIAQRGKTKGRMV